MAGPTENTPLTGETISHDASEHYPVASMTGHGVRMSTRRSTRRSDAQSLPNNESITEWKPDDGGEDSDFSALMNLVTGAIGSGVVYLPYAAGECGLLLGLILICLMAWVSAHSTTIIGTVLLMARNIAKKRGCESVIETFEDISKVCWGSIGFWVISFINYLDLYLTVAVFMGTLASATNDLIAEFIQNGRGSTEEERGKSPIEFWWLLASVFGFMALVMPLCWLKSMDAISKMSLLGVIANLVILICIVISAFGNKDGTPGDNNGLNYNINQYYMHGISPQVQTNDRQREKMAHMFGPSGEAECAKIGTVADCTGDCQWQLFGEIGSQVGACIGKVCEALTGEDDCNNVDGCNWDGAVCGNQGQIKYRLFDFGGMWKAYGNFGFSYAVAVVTPSLIAGMKNPGHLGRIVWSSHFIICAIYCAVILVSWLAWGNGVISCNFETLGDGASSKENFETCAQQSLGDCEGFANEKGAKLCQKFTFQDGEKCVPLWDFNLGSANVISHDFMPVLAVQTIAMLGLLVSIVSSVPLFFFSIAVMVEDVLKKKYPNISDFFLRYVNRTILMAICLAPIFALNAGYPDSDNLGEFQGLTGAVTTTIICSILPNLLFFCMTKKFPEGHKFRSGNVWFSICCAIALGVGVFTMVVGFLADGLGLFGVTVFY